MEDKGLEFAKPPPEPEDQSGVNRSVPRSTVMRELGMKHKTTNVPPELQWAAEDRMVMRSHEDFRCQLPDVSRSTFLMVFSPDGKKVASTHGNHNVYVTDLTSGKNIKTLTGHPRTPWCIAFHPSSNQILASGCLGGQVRVWDLSGGSEIWMAESQTVIASLAFHPIDRMLVVASYNELHFWDWSQPEPFAKCFTANEKEKVRYVAFDTLGHKLITGIANAPTRPTSQWDRVAAPQPPPPPTQQMDSERRITICYRYMVEQYEQLVQRYCDLSRARATLTMDRGTDPMETEGETSDSQRERPTTSTPRAGPSTSPGQSRRTLASGTDEASASHSSTEFLSPPPGEEVRPLLSISPHASDPDTPVRRNPRFNISLPSFSRSQNARPQTTGATSRPLSRYSLSLATARDLTSPPSGWTASSTTEAPNTTPPITRGDSILGNVFWNSRDEPSDGTSTEVNSGLESENEEVDVQNVPQSGEESQAQSSSDIDYQPLASNNTSRSPRSSESSARRSSEASVSQLRSQFHRLQSVYENRNNAYSSHAHVFSPETQDAERRLLTRLNEILERPLPEANRPRRFFVSRRSAFQPRPASSPAPEVSAPGTTAAATTSDAIGGVRYGIQLLSRHIDNMQRLCRARLEILQLQQIRRMWEDLQSQIYALHGAVRDNTPAASTNAATSPTVTSSSTAAAAAADLLTDDDSDGPGSNGDFHWRQRRTPQTNRRHIPPRTLNKRSRLMFRPADYNRRMAAAQMEVARRELNRQASSSTQATSEGERGEASSSHVSSTSDERGSERGVKRKSQDCDPLFRPRPTVSAATSTTPNNPRPSTSRMAAAMSAAGSGLPGVIRETIIQLENALWRHSNPRHNATRNTRLSRFTRQREERRLRNLWDTESSHESSRDDQSEGDSSQQSTPCEADNIDNVWIRESTRMRARQVLLLMVDSLTNFFENDNLTQRPDTNEALNDRIHNLYVLLQLALNLTDLLLAQLVHSRRELESRPSNTTDNRNTMRATQYALRASRYALRASRHARSRTSLAWRRILRRAPPTSCAGEQQPTRRSTPNNNGPPGGCSRGAPPHRHTFRHVPGGLPHPPPRPPIVPIVRVNDLPVPPPEATPAPRVRLYSPPMNPMLIPPRFFYPASTRYAPAESTSEDSSPAQDRSNDFFFMRAGYGPSSVILTDTPMSPHHRIQAWDFSQFKLPDLGNAEKNIVVSECKIHNDASVDMSKDGRLLVTLLPSGRLSMTTLLGVYSLQWSTLGQLLYTTSFEQSIVSVSLSPTTRHLVVGLASRRVAVVSSDRHTNAQVFRLEGASPGRKLPFGGRGRLLHQRDLDLSRHLGFMSLNCIRWAPHPGQGLVYGTNTGHLRILR